MYSTIIYRYNTAPRGLMCFHGYYYASTTNICQSLFSINLNAL
ncbi:hypothetical protein 7t3_0152 [Salmonella phage 7t3]|nr:hypothetical protein 7t3_0152 [Salmonella phage 7t3]